MWEEGKHSPTCPGSKTSLVPGPLPNFIYGWGVGGDKIWEWHLNEANSRATINLIVALELASFNQLLTLFHLITYSHAIV